MAQLKEAAKVLPMRIENNEKQIRSVKVDISGINQAMAAVQISTAKIATGINELKQKNVSRLEKELDDANREIRRMRRND